MIRFLLPVLPILLAASAMPIAHAVEPEPAAQHESPAAADAQAQARRHDLAEALVTMARVDETMFNAIVDQGVSFGAGRSGQRDEAMEAAWQRLRPELRTVTADALAGSCSESALRAAIGFYATDGGQEMAATGAAVNGLINREAGKRWQEWIRRIRETPAPAEPPAKREAGF